MRKASLGVVLYHRLSRLSDGGLLNRMRRHWWGRKTPCEDDSFTDLDFTHTATAFIILLGGSILALVFLFLERLQWKRTLQNVSVTTRASPKKVLHTLCESNEPNHETYNRKSSQGRSRRNTMLFSTSKTRVREYITPVN